MACWKMHKNYWVWGFRSWPGESTGAGGSGLLQDSLQSLCCKRWLSLACNQLASVFFWLQRRQRKHRSEQKEYLSYLFFMNLWHRVVFIYSTADECCTAKITDRLPFQGWAQLCASGIKILGELCWIGWVFLIGVFLASLTFHPKHQQGSESWASWIICSCIPTLMALDCGFKLICRGGLTLGFEKFVAFQCYLLLYS